MINGHFTVEEQGATMRNMQKSHSGDGDLQSVSKEDSDRDSIGSVRPQSAASAGQWNTLRAEGGQGAVLPAQPGEQVNNKTNFEADSEESAFSMAENQTANICKTKR